MWRIGQVIVTEGGLDIQGKILRWGEGSPWTHTFLVTGQDEMIEADKFVGVRSYSMIKRMAELRSDNRSWVVLEPQQMSVEDRLKVVAMAKSLVGIGYDYFEAMRFVLTHRMHPSSPHRVTCARLVADTFMMGANWPVFTNESIRRAPIPMQADLLMGRATPTGLLFYSQLRVFDVHFVPGRKYPMRKP